MSIFGQNPADITGAVFKSKNFSDIPDKAAARNNLDVPSKADVLYNSVPVGMILPYWGSVAPAGYLPCSGQTITSGTFPELVTFLGGGASAVVPDLRGEFLRGWDNGRGVDVGRSNLSSQVGTALRSIASNGASNSSSHIWANSEFDGLGSITYYQALTSATTVSVQTGNVRPRNVSVLYCIKAYSSVANYTSSVNIAGLISDYSTLNAAAVKYADFIGANQNKVSSGYQKLPGGIIIQWATGTANTTPATLSYPIVFPNAVTNVQISASIASNIGVTTLSGIPIFSTSNGTGVYVLAIGY